MVVLEAGAGERADPFDRLARARVVPAQETVGGVEPRSEVVLVEQGHKGVGDRRAMVRAVRDGLRGTGPHICHRIPE